MVEKEDGEKKEKTSSVEKKSKKKEEKKDLHFCKDCKWYDKSAEREFHRKVGPKNEEGGRTEITEIRAICRNKNANACNHLVMAEYSKRQCPVWESGAYTKSPEEQNRSGNADEKRKTGECRKKKASPAKADSAKMDADTKSENAENQISKDLMQP